MPRRHFTDLPWGEAERYRVLRHALDSIQAAPLMEHWIWRIYCLAGFKHACATLRGWGARA